MLCFEKMFIHPGESLTYFCQKTHNDDAVILYPTQQLYLNYFFNIISGIKFNTQKYVLQKVIFSEIPSLQKNPHDFSAKKPIKPYIQIYKDGKTVYNSIKDN